MQLGLSTYNDSFQMPSHPVAGDQVMRGGKRAVVTSVDTERDNPRGDIVLCVTWLDSGRDGVLFGQEVEVHFKR